MLKLTKRSEVSQVWVWGSPILAIVLTFLTGIILFSLMGVNPIKAGYAFFIEPLQSSYGIAELFLKATPMVLIALALSVGFRAGVWNIGAEGQLVIGAIVGSGIVLYFENANGPWLLPLSLIAGVLGGMAWAAIPAFLRTRFNANEILVSLMLTYVAGLLLSYLVHGPWRDPAGFNFPESRDFQDAARLAIIWERTRLHVGFLAMLVAVGAFWFALSRSRFGFEVNVVGQAPKAARYVGFSNKLIIWVSLLLGGAMAGLAGIFEISGPIGQLQPVISPGYGFTAIIVAFVGRLHPVGVLLAGLMMALSYLGGENAQISINLPMAVTGVFQGMLLFFLLACDVLIGYRISFTRGGNNG